MYGRDTNALFVPSNTGINDDDKREDVVEVIETAITTTLITDVDYEPATSEF